MKKTILIFGLFISFYGSSQELMNFYLSPFTLTSESSVTLHTTFFAYSGAGIVNYDYTIDGNIINFRLCYAVGSSTVYTLDKKVFEIITPNNFGDYIFKISLFTDYDGQMCNYENITDSGTINFSLPYNPTEKIEITDTAVESYLEYLNFGDNIFANGEVFKHRIENLLSLYLSNLYFDKDGVVESLTSIEHFKALKNLYIYNQLVADINLEFNTDLEKLWCDGNPLESLDITNNFKLKRLWCRNIDLNELDLSNNSLLEEFSFSSNSITNINLIDKLYLRDLELSTPLISSLDLSNNLLLERVHVSNTLLTSLDLSNNSLLYFLNISQNELLTQLDISSLTGIFRMYCYGNIIEELDLSLNTNLSKVHLQNNNLNFLNIKNGNNEDIYEIITIMNPNLFCIEVDNVVDEGQQPFDYQIDSQTEFSEDCQ